MAQFAHKVSGKESVSRIRIIIGVIMIIAAIVIGLLVIPSLVRTNRTYHIIRVRENIPAKTRLNADGINRYFEDFQTNDALLAQTTLEYSQENLDKINGKYANKNLYQGNFISQNDFDTLAILTKNSVPDGYEIIALRVPSSESFVGFTPKEGDIVKIYGTERVDVDTVQPDGSIKTESVNRTVEYELLQYVQIYKILDATGYDTSYAAESRTMANMLMVLRYEQVKQLIEMSRGGAVYMTLASSGDEEKADELLALQDTIINRRGELAALANEPQKENKLVTAALLQLKEAGDIKAGDIVKLAYTRTSEYEYLDENYRIVKEKKTELIYDDLLSCIKVNDTYDTNGISFALTIAGETGLRTLDAYGLELCDTQMELLDSLTSKNQLFIMKVEEPELTAKEMSEGVDPYQSLFDKVDQAIRKVEYEKIMGIDHKAPETADPTSDQPYIPVIIPTHDEPTSEPTAEPTSEPTAEVTTDATAEATTEIEEG